MLRGMLKRVEDMLRTEMGKQWVGGRLNRQLVGLTAPLGLSHLDGNGPNRWNATLSPTSTGGTDWDDVQVWDEKADEGYCCI